MASRSRKRRAGPYVCRDSTQGKEGIEAFVARTAAAERLLLLVGDSEQALTFVRRWVAGRKGAECRTGIVCAGSVEEVVEAEAHFPSDASVLIVSPVSERSGDALAGVPGQLKAHFRECDARSDLGVVVVPATAAYAQQWADVAGTQRLLGEHVPSRGTTPCAVLFRLMEAPRACAAVSVRVRSVVGRVVVVQSGCRGKTTVPAFLGVKLAWEGAEASACAFLPRAAAGAVEPRTMPKGVSAWAQVGSIRGKENDRSTPATSKLEEDGAGCGAGSDSAQLTAGLPAGATAGTLCVTVFPAKRASRHGAMAQSHGTTWSATQRVELSGRNARRRVEIVVHGDGGGEDSASDTRTVVVQNVLHGRDSATNHVDAGWLAPPPPAVLAGFGDAFVVRLELASKE